MLEIKGLCKTFGTNNVLNDINLSVAKGESLVIIGGSGTGKSVLLKCILGLETPDKGEVFIDNQHLTHHNRDNILSRIGMLFQGSALFDSLRVWENIAFRHLYTVRKLSKADAYDLAIEKLHRVGLKPPVAKRYPAELSGGMQKRVALARAIADNPEIIFFDEPTTGLDPIMSGVINKLIREIVTEMGATTITITHDMSSVRMIADQIAMIHDGSIKWSGHINEIDATDNPYLNQFIKGDTKGPIKAMR